MSVLATYEAAPPTLFDLTGGESMLDDALVDVWEGLTAHRVVQCLVCGEEMAPQYGAHSRPVGGRCASCGSILR